MRTSLTAAVVAFILLSDRASAGIVKRHVVTISKTTTVRVPGTRTSCTAVQAGNAQATGPTTVSGVQPGYASGSPHAAGGPGGISEERSYTRSTRTRTRMTTLATTMTRIPSSSNASSTDTVNSTSISRPVPTSSSISSEQRSSTQSAPAPSTSAISTSIPPPASSSQSSPPSEKASSTTPASPSPTQPPSPPTPSSPDTPFLRGVNLGGWLVLEKWMNSDLFKGPFASAKDQYTFDSTNGAAAALETHWLTFFTEADIKTIAATGINALRIPIGFWAYDNDHTPYIKGADAYLEKAIGWARNANLKVWVDCHGMPGSQNGFDHSGQGGSVDWQQKSNLEHSISVLQTMATKYGAMEYADVVVGLELVNEPISYGNNKFSTTQDWTKDAYAAVSAAAANKNMKIIMHDGFQGAGKWTDVASTLNKGGARNFGVDSHLYQVFNDEDNKLDQKGHISKACSWSRNLKSANDQFPVYVGEWSAATNICVNPDGSTTAGTSCGKEGCQCQSEDFDKWNEKMVEQVRRYVEAQLDVFEGSTSGYFAWSAKGPGGWGFLNGIKKGVIPNPVTDRKFGGQCGGK